MFITLAYLIYFFNCFNKNIMGAIIIICRIGTKITPLKMLFTFKDELKNIKNTFFIKSNTLI